MCRQLHYKVGFMPADGAAKATIANMSVSLKVQIVEEKLDNGNMVPGIRIYDSKVVLPPDSMNLTLQGSFIVTLADILLPLFKSTINDQVTQQVTNALDQLVAPELNKLISSQHGFTELYHGMDLDWSIASVPKVDQLQLSGGIKGLLFPESKGEVEPPVPAPVMPLHDDKSPAKFQAFVSAYVADSLAYSFLQTNKFDIWTNSSAAPKGFPITLSTSGLDYFFPGLSTHYGADLPVDIEYRLESLRNFTAVADSQELGFNADLTLRFWVENTNGSTVEAIVINLNEFSFSWTALIDNMTFSANVTQAHIGDLVDVESAPFISWELWAVKTLLNEGLSWGMPLFNTFIQTSHIEIPSLLFGMFKLTDPVFTFHDGFVQAGLTPHFLPPPSLQFSRPQSFELSEEFDERVTFDRAGSKTIYTQN